MSDWFSTAVEMQREILRAQKAAEANLAAWKQWTKLWGWK